MTVVKLPLSAISPCKYPKNELNVFKLDVFSEIGSKFCWLTLLHFNLLKNVPIVIFFGICCELIRFFRFYYETNTICIAPTLRYCTQR